ncbi:MAG: hypothetical protein QG588_1649, partial [Candidatus Poribacteria bacterium]|nr:hypothetical protein [Candidatus Poribacteria bacterium]
DFEDKIVFSITDQEIEQIPNSFQANSKDEFLDILKAIFSSSKAKRVISALLAQSNPESKAS